MTNRAFPALLLFVWVAVLAFVAPIAPASAEEQPQPATIDNPNIPTDELATILKPLTRDELFVEADGWQGLVQKKSEEIAEADVLIKRLNGRVIAAMTRKRRSPRAEALQKATRALDAAKAGGDAAAIEKAGTDLEAARIRGADADIAAAATQEAAIGAKDRAAELAEIVQDLRAQRRGLFDRFEEVLAAIEDKTGKEDADTLKKVEDYRLYMSGVKGVKVKLEDTQSTWLVAKTWLTSPEGGLRWGEESGRGRRHSLRGLARVKIIGGLIHRALRVTGNQSELLEHFLVGTARWVVMLIGFITALAALEVSVTPLLAAVGAAGFVIAFAMQDSLSNVASGLMILLFKPFDVGDVVTAGGVTGKVASMNLVSTTINMFDNQRMVVPNNKIWSDIITNSSGIDRRRVDMEFGISYADDVEKAQSILEDVVASHPKILKDPEPMVKMHTLADSSVNFVVWPWAEPADFGTVRWDVIKEVKKRFDAEGINIPFPQQDVHLHISDGDIERLKGLSGAKA
ncbi:MAG: mechanosensitive ion channel family protein [Rhodospirillales bacterium]|nr:mechanosensitive ion channel family protein [Rhodospirillales bacterium]